jgi:hypothetical protein
MHANYISGNEILIQQKERRMLSKFTLTAPVHALSLFQRIVLICEPAERAPKVLQTIKISALQHGKQFIDHMQISTTPENVCLLRVPHHTKRRENATRKTQV